MYNIYNYVDKELNCWCCSNITNVEKLVNLTKLNCRRCQNITNEIKQLLRSRNVKVCD